MPNDIGGEPSRLLIRTTSNTYFPQVMSVISLPDRDETVKVAVDTVWEFLAEVEDLDMLRYERRKARVNAALEGLSDDEAFAEIQARRDGSGTENKSVKQAELETLIASQEEIGEDRPDGNFFARMLPQDRWEQPWMASIERVVLVHRLREVVALAGFTRFEALAPDIEGELEMGVRRATLARETTWLPAIENKGEGIFLQFKKSCCDLLVGAPRTLLRPAIPGPVCRQTDEPARQMCRGRYTRGFCLFGQFHRSRPRTEH